MRWAAPILISALRSPGKGHTTLTRVHTVHRVWTTSSSILRDFGVLCRSKGS